MFVYSNYFVKYIKKTVRQRPVFFALCNKNCFGLTKVEFKYMLRNFNNYFYKEKEIELNFVNRRWTTTINFDISQEFNVGSLFIFTYKNFLAYQNYTHPAMNIPSGSIFSINVDICCEPEDIFALPTNYSPILEKSFNWQKEGF